MSDQHDELKRQAAALQEIMNKPCQPRSYERKPKGNSGKHKRELNYNHQLADQHDE